MRKLSQINETSWGGMVRRSSGEIMRKEEEINKDFILNILVEYYGFENNDVWDVNDKALPFFGLGKKFEKALRNKKNVISVDDEIHPDGTFFILLFSKDKNIFSIFDTHQERRPDAPKVFVAYTWGVRLINSGYVWKRIDDGVPFATSRGGVKTIREMFGDDLFDSIGFYEYAIIVE